MSMLQNGLLTAAQEVVPQVHYRMVQQGWK